MANPKDPFDWMAEDGSVKEKGMKKTDAIKTSGTTDGKSNRLGGGGRAQQLKDEGVPGGVIGKIARAEGVYGHNDFKKGPGKGSRPKGK